MKSRTYNLFSVIMTLIFIISVSVLSAQFAGGSGTENDPYMIATPEHLNNIRYYLSDHFVQIADIDLSDYLSPGGDGYNEGAGWDPIGHNNLNPFTGSYNGLYNDQTYTISNLYINRTDGLNIGLFGYSRGATFDNITLLKVSVTGGYHTVGSLVGHMESNYNHGSLTNIYVEGIVNNPTIVINDIWTGGIIGYLTAAEINNCHVNVTVIGGNGVGGIAGYLDTLSRIRNSSSSGSISGDNHVGGIAGGLHGSSGDYTNNKMLNCFSSADVEGTDKVGGLVGHTTYRANIINSSSTGNVSGTNMVGGLVGHNLQCTIRDSYSTGIVIGTEKVGGLVGSQEWFTSDYNNPYIIRSYSSSDVSGISKVGGLLGYQDSRGRTSNSYATGNVIGLEQIGGLTGYNEGGQLLRTYSVGQVSVPDGMTGLDVGGLVGLNTGYVHNSYWDKISSGQENSDGGTGKTTLQMLQDETYSSWDFEQIWELRGFHNYSHIRKTYPILRWQEEPGEHNYIEGNAHVKIYKGRNWYWEGFPRLEVISNPYTTALLEPLALYGSLREVQSKVGNQTVSMLWDSDNQVWTGYYVVLNRTDGYKFKFETRDKDYLYARGDRAPADTLLTIYHNQENWIGYFIPEPQHVFEAFNTVIDSLESIKAEYWSMYRYKDQQERSHWIYSYDPHYSGGPVLEYGKMYQVVTRDFVVTDLTFSWPEPLDTIPIPKIPRSAYFNYEEKADYESFFIEEINEDHNVLEVGIYAGEDCVGASVFCNGYPLEILAYTDASHYDQEISFVIYREGERGAREMIRIPLVRDNETGTYTARKLYPLRQRFTVVKLNSNTMDFETIVEPEIVLSQNYPNPFTFMENKRSSLTEIPFYVSGERDVTLTIYNIKGQRVKMLYEGVVQAGKHQVGWNGLNDQNQQVASGVYFYRLQSGDKEITRKMLLIR